MCLTAFLKVILKLNLKRGRSVLAGSTVSSTHVNLIRKLTKFNVENDPVCLKRDAVIHPDRKLPGKVQFS